MVRIYALTTSQYLKPYLQNNIFIKWCTSVTLPSPFAQKLRIQPVEMAQRGPGAFLCGVRMCVGSLLVLRLPPTVQSHAFGREVNRLTELVLRCECECEWLLVSPCWPSDSPREYCTRVYSASHAKAAGTVSRSYSIFGFRKFCLIKCVRGKGVKTRTKYHFQWVVLA